MARPNSLRDSSGGSGAHNIGHVVLIAAAAALGGFLFGYDTAVINGAVGAIQDRFDAGGFAIGTTVSSALLGSAVGAWFAGSLADRIGRVRVMMIAAVMFGISAIGSAFPFGIIDLAAWRIVGGIAVGIASVIGPAYISEVSPANYRGRLSSFQQLAIVLGIALSALVNYFIAAVAGGSSEPLLGAQAWQWMLAIEVIPALAYGLLALTIPESPRYLVAAGKLDRARQVLAEIEEGDIDARIEQVRESLRMQRRPRLSDLRGRFGVLPIVWVGMGIAALQQFVGINVIFYYQSTLWQSVGVGESQSLLIAVVSGVVNIVGTFVGIALIDKIGRKPLLLAGSVGMAITLGTAAYCFSHAVGTGDAVSMPAPYGTIALIAANAFVFSFAATWGPIMWVLLGEMFPNRLRAAAMSVATAMNWIANWLVTISFPPLSETNLSFAYGLYTFFAVISFFFVWRFVSETKGKTLEEMG